MRDCVGERERERERGEREKIREIEIRLFERSRKRNAMWEREKKQIVREMEDARKSRRERAVYSINRG